MYGLDEIRLIQNYNNNLATIYLFNIKSHIFNIIPYIEKSLLQRKQ